MPPQQDASQPGRCCWRVIVFCFPFLGHLDPNCHGMHNCIDPLCCHHVQHPNVASLQSTWFQATQLSTGRRAPVTWTSLKLSWLSPRCSIPSSSDLFEKLQKLKRNFIAKERKISVIWLISIFLLQVQLNTSNKLGETPIKTAAMSGKVKLDEKMQSLEISFVIMSYTIPTEFVCRHSIPYYLINLLDVSAIAKYFGSAARFLGLNPYPHSLFYPHDPTMSCNWR